MCDEKYADFKDIQVLQKHLLRFLNGTKLKDKVTISSLLVKFNYLSVNQLAAQIKLGEVWKALKIEDYPLKIKKQSLNKDGACTRAATSGKPCEIGKKTLTKKLA